MRDAGTKAHYEGHSTRQEEKTFKIKFHDCPADIQLSKIITDQS